MKVKHRLLFAILWTGIYSVAFNLFPASFAGARVIVLAPSLVWVFWLFYLASYSRLFFFGLIPFVFISSSVIAYAEHLTNTPISRDVVASAFQSNWQEMTGLASMTFWIWILGGLTLATTCSWHFANLPLHHGKWSGFNASLTFLAVFWYCSSAILSSNLENIFLWQHPYDYLEYTANYLKQEAELFRLQSKFDLAALPSERQSLPDRPLQVAVIIGEAARADHFGIYGYARNTTPLLQQQKNLLAFNDVKSCGTTTMVSVPCMLTRATRDNLKPSRHETSFISLFKKHGFETIWISEQAKFNGINTVVASISEEADVSVFQDNNLTLKLNEFKDHFVKAISHSDNEKLAVFHMLGSHLPYQWMYPVKFRRFAPECPELHPEACPRDQLINNYDNTIVFTDYFLANVVAALKDQNALMVYVADHGEYLGERERFLHGHDTEDAELRHVPMLVWYSDVFARLNPDKIERMRSKLNHNLSHDNLFHSVLDCAGIESQAIDRSLSICR